MLRYEVELYAFQLMSNHWHLLLRPNLDGEMSKFLRWISATHTMRYHAHYHTSGEGHVYQGRFKSFPIQDDEHVFTVCRYVERNALEAKTVMRADLPPRSLKRRHSKDSGPRGSPFGQSLEFAGPQALVTEQRGREVSSLTITKRISTKGQ